MKFNKLVGFTTLFLSLSLGGTALAADGKTEAAAEAETMAKTDTMADTEKMVKAEIKLPAQDTGPLFENIKITDHVIGNPDAKVTIVEYASLTCPHCANFHENTFKEFKKNYIDTNKVKFVYRNFHLDQLALAATMLAECAPAEQYYPIINLIFSNQSKWIRAEKQFAEMVNILKLVGYTDEKVNECFAKKEVISNLLDDRKYAAEVLNVSSTPTLFINGEKQEGGNTGYEAFSATVDGLLAE